LIELKRFIHSPSIPELHFPDLRKEKATILIAALVHQADNFALPFALLAARTFLPPALLILALKP